MKKEEVASMIDHTLLLPDATEEDILKLCNEASVHAFASVCVNPVYVPLAFNSLKDTGVKVCTVVGFPLGATPTKNKVFEAVSAIHDGASEIDMVINFSKAREGNFNAIQKDIAEVVSACKGAKSDSIVKVILETCFLSDDEIEKACKAAVSAKADFVKTSTGFANPKDKSGNPLPNGASAHHVSIMRHAVRKLAGVKASGGIRTAEDAKKMIEAGATRIGTSSGVKIISDWIEAN